MNTTAITKGEGVLERSIPVLCRTWTALPRIINLYRPLRLTLIPLASRRLQLMSQYSSCRETDSAHFICLRDPFPLHVSLHSGEV
jgi:hypothetical protein